jgi:hypothetical protein
MDNNNNMEESDNKLNFIDDELDGVDTNSSRSTDFGLPLEIKEIFPSPDQEFEASGEEKTRALTALDFRSQVDQTPEVEFDAGANFQASQSIFAPASLDSKQVLNTVSAPSLPSYLRPAKTSFRSVKPIAFLMPELEHAFELYSVNFMAGENGPCTYACSVMVLLAMVEFEVRIFAADCKEHLIEFRHLSGCRYAFSSSFNNISQKFVEVSSVSTHVPMKFAPLPFGDLEDLEMPSLAMSRNVDHEVNMIASTASFDSMLQGVRAVGSIHDIDMNGFGMPLAKRVTELASSKTESDELRGVAMGALANIASIENISLDWLNSSVDTVVAGVEDEQPHVRREAIRSLEIMSKRDSALAAKFVRAGVVPLLELEAEGGSEDAVKDIPAQQFAKGALAACRA